MNIAPEILNYLGEKREFTEVILAPKASPVERRGRGIEKVMDVILSPDDIRDTLVSLRSHTSTSLGPLGREGFFSFGMPDVGRIRVTYLTQRGSYVVSIVKVPYDIPDLEDLVSPKENLESLFESLRSYNGILAVIGKSFVIHNLFSYSLLKELCVRESGLIYVLERPITYLIKHSNSIVIQREVGVDVDSFSEGVEEALFMHPDIIYISDIAIKDALNSVKKLFDIPVLTILSMTASSVEALKRSFEVFLKEDSGDVLRLISKVIELGLDEEERISFKVRDI
ncbi:twitching mobility protein [Hydrogenivirga sp. 128-5-R1-1]|uniref:twitching mobility protein n=1 Tax=Hydrogenivirga sp. 128-5-R1-1 TaxID=392423 RepID=UPI00015EF062|nr:twitching mobility protein [Hydrogenivirga sp. 128-5-R1-1]EDP74719.1 twitching mobility protein [Hydrogenivirga sp. 128-5-R1-1]